MQTTYLKKGDTVAVVSPSAGVPSIFPHIYDNGLKILEEWGLKVREYPTTRGDSTYNQNHPEERARDLNEAFADTDIKAIITSIGGNDGIRVLPFLDKNVITANPKLFMGYSDTTAFHFYLNMLGIESWYGPAIMAGFSQMDSLPDFKEHTRQMLFGEFNGTYKPYSLYSDGYPDWTDAKNVGKVNEQKHTDGWHWLQGSSAEGKIFGGCIELFQMLNGTKWWPHAPFWDDKIIFFETSEEAPTISYVEHQLRSMSMQGIFDTAPALIVGRPRDYSDEKKEQLETKVLDIVVNEFNRPDMVVITNFDVGHTDPQLILPLGRKLKLDAVVQTVQLS